MKSLIVFFLVSAVGIHALDKATVDQILEKVTGALSECVESEKATPEDVEPLHNHLPPTTQTGKCVVFCVAKKLNFMDEEGKFQEPHSELIEKIRVDEPDTYEKMLNVFETCSSSANSKRKDDLCETAVDFSKCVKDEHQKAGFDQPLIST